MASPVCVWQRPGWPVLSCDRPKILSALQATHKAQALVEGRLGAVGFGAQLQLAAQSWTEEAVATAAIEGERLDLESVRSSVGRRLGLAGARQSKAPRHVEGLLDVMADAVDRARDPLTDARLQAWQRALFPTGHSGLYPVAVGAYRSGAGPMQIVSGPIGRETVHFEAPPSKTVPREMRRLLQWFNAERERDTLVRAALAHLWFETIHPFEDGNGRVGRAIVDLTLARETGGLGRIVRISQQLSDHRDAYYDRLNAAQRGDLDVTSWVLWFVSQVGAACEKALAAVDLSLAKARFWVTHADQDLNARQRKAVNVLLDAGPGGFEGGLSTRKYGSLASTSRATASRELIDLATRGLLVSVGAGRSTRYYVNLEGWLP